MSLTSNTPVRVGIVGLGYWGPNLTRVLNEIDCADVVTVCDLNETALAKIVRRYPAVRPTARFDDLVDDESLDAIVIATSVATHFDLAYAALEGGKHVFVEKPMAGSVAEAEELVSLAEERRLTLMPGHTFLYSPPVNAVHDLIQQGELGDIYFISTSRVNLGLHQPDVSVIWDLGPHDFSILRYWLGESPEQVSAMTRSCIIPGTPDVAFVNAQHASGTVAHVELSWLAPSKLRRTAVVGSNKMVVYDDTSTEPVRIFDSGADLPEPKGFGEFRLTYRTGDIVSPRIDAGEPLALELADFCAAIRQGSTPRSSWSVGLDVLRTIEAVDRSVALGGVPVETTVMSSS